MEKEEREMLQLLGFYSVLSQSGELAGPLAEYLLFPDTNTEDQLPFHILLVLLSCDQLFATPWTSSLAGSSVHGILQATILEWVAIPFSRGSSQPRDRTQVSPALQADSLPSEPPGKHNLNNLT